MTPAHPPTRSFRFPFVVHASRVHARTNVQARRLHNNRSSNLSVLVQPPRLPRRVDDLVPSSHSAGAVGGNSDFRIPNSEFVPLHPSTAQAKCGPKASYIPISRGPRRAPALPASACCCSRCRGGSSTVRQLCARSRCTSRGRSAGRPWCGRGSDRPCTRDRPRP